MTAAHHLERAARRSEEISRPSNHGAQNSGGKRPWRTLQKIEGLSSLNLIYFVDNPLVTPGRCA
jgi:hypothetical protein